MTRTPLLLLLQLLLAAPPAGAQQPSSVDPYHTAPRDTLDAERYEGWKRYSLLCDRCHGQTAEGTSFGPNLVASLGPGGAMASREAFVSLMIAGRPDRGMPPAATLGLEPEHFDAVYSYLRGRGTGELRGGRPARREP